VRVRDAFDVVIDNCSITGCAAAVKAEFFAKAVGQIKVVGGFNILNDYGVSIDHASTDPAVSQGPVSVFGCTFGHKRTENGPEQIAVHAAKPITGIYLFGNAFEDVAHVVDFDASFPSNYTGRPPLVLAAIGNSFFNMPGTGEPSGAWIDTHAAYPSMGAAADVGNTASEYVVPPIPPSVPALVNIAKVLNTGKGGMLLGGNAFSAYPPVDGSFPDNVYPREKSSQFGPLPAYTTTTRPDAATLPPGFAMFNTSTSRINVADGGYPAIWRDANGNPV